MEIADYSKFIRSPNRIKLYQDRLKMLKVRYPIPSFFQLILRVFFKLTADIINKGLRISKILLEKSLELELNNRSGALVVAIV